MAVEPIPANLAALKANLAQQDAGERVTCVAAALGSGEGSAELTYYPRMPGNSTRYPAEKRQLQGSCMRPTWFDGSSMVEWQGRTLSSIFDEYELSTVHLLKLDVEGAELKALHGIEARHWSCVQQIVAEVHDVDDRLAATAALLESHNFEVTQVPTDLLHNWLFYATRKR